MRRRRGGELASNGPAPSRATPVSFLVRDNLTWLLAAARGDGVPLLPREGAARDVLECLRARGALFFSEIVCASRRLRVEVAEGLWELVARGLVTAPTASAARGRSCPRASAGRGGRWPASARRPAPRGVGGRGAEGRWSLLPTSLPARARRRDLGRGGRRTTPRALRRGLPRSRGARDAGAALA